MCILGSFPIIVYVLFFQTPTLSKPYPCMNTHSHTCVHTILLYTVHRYICMTTPPHSHTHTHTALSSFSPASVALTDLIRSQLSLIRFSMDTTQRQVDNIYASTQSGHHYTTLEETKAVSRNLVAPSTFNKICLKKEQLQILGCGDTLYINIAKYCM